MCVIMNMIDIVIAGTVKKVITNYEERIRLLQHVNEVPQLSVLQRFKARSFIFSIHPSILINMYIKGRALAYAIKMALGNKTCHRQ